MLHNISPERVIAVYKEMNLPEPFVWARWERGELAGMVTGHIKRHIEHDYRLCGFYLDVDHMIVLPASKNKLRTMMRMSEDATQAAFEHGCGYVVLNILHEDDRRRGLDAWARRCSYLKYATTDSADWYIRRRPTKEDHIDGQEGLPSEAAAAPDTAGSEC